MMSFFQKKIYGNLAIIFLVVAILAGYPVTSAFADSRNASASRNNQIVSDVIREDSRQAKYIFLFIGDGMAVAQRDAAEIFLAATKNGQARPEDTKLLMNTFPVQGMTTTYDLSSIITDSASAGTALATGNKTISGTINMDPAFKEKYTTIAEIAKQKGWKVGIVSNVSIDHATPASFYAHQASRKSYYDIAIELVKSDFDYFAGGGFLEPAGKSNGYVNVLDFAKWQGYTYINSRADFDKLASGAGKTLVVSPILQDEQSLNYDMDRPKEDITLAEYTSKGIELLNNPNGFFMMVEGGKIDWSCHANDAAATIKDTLAFDDAIAPAVEFYKQHPDDTLIIVTGDHETGGLTIGFAGTGYANYIERIQNQKVSYVAFNAKLDEFKASHEKGAIFTDVIPLIEENFGLDITSAEEYKALKDTVTKGAEKEATDADKAAAKDATKKLGMMVNPDERALLEEAFEASMMKKEDRTSIPGVDLLYGGYEPLTVKLTTILNQKAGLGWTTYSHTGIPVMTSAIGVGSELFNGYYDNTDIYLKMMEIAGL